MNNIEITWKKIFISIVLLIYSSYLSLILINTWSWFIFGRVIIIYLIILILIYKLTQSILYEKKNLIFNIKSLDYLYNKVLILYNYKLFYNEASNKMDEIYIPQNLLKYKNIKSNFWIKSGIITFIIIYIIINTLKLNFFIFDYYFKFVFFLYFIYISFCFYLNKKFINPNVYHFQITNKTFFPDGTLGWTAYAFSKQIKGRTPLQWCGLCLMGALFSNWAIESILPNRKPPLQILGDKIEEIPGVKDKIDKYLPLKDPSINPQKNPPISYSGPYENIK